MMKWCLVFWGIKISICVELVENDNNGVDAHIMHVAAQGINIANGLEKF